MKDFICHVFAFAVIIALVWATVGQRPAQAWSDNDTARALNNIDASLVRIANALEKCK